MRRFKVFVGAPLMAAFVVASPQVSSADDFYKGKSVEILVGFSTGGGYDAYGRALAAAIGKYIPGNPLVVVRNLTGAGSLRLATHLQEAAPRDGLSFGIFDDGLQIASLIKPQVVRFNPSNLNWIGSTAKDQQVCMTWHDFPARKVTDLRNKEANFGVTGLDDVRYMSTAMLKNIVGAKVKIVPGYPGSADIRLAIENRELDGVCDSWQSVKSTKSDWIKDKKITVLVQMGLKKHEDLPDVPLIGDYTHMPEEAGALTVLLAPSEAGRSFAAPPNVPAERLQILRRAFDASMKDKDFLAITQQSQLEVNPLSGEDVQTYIKKIYDASPKDVEIARRLVE